MCHEKMTIIKKKCSCEQYIFNLLLLLSLEQYKNHSNTLKHSNSFQKQNKPLHSRLKMELNKSSAKKSYEIFCSLCTIGSFGALHLKKKSKHVDFNVF